VLSGVLKYLVFAGGELPDEPDDEAKLVAGQLELMNQLLG
jgi:hypothetical protein